MSRRTPPVRATGLCVLLRGRALLLVLLGIGCAPAGRYAVAPPGPIAPARLSKPGGTLWLVGTITEGITESAVQGAAITRLDGAGRATSDREGHYALAVHNLPGATIRVRVSGRGFQSHELDVQLVELSTTLDVRLLPEEPDSTATSARLALPTGRSPTSAVPR